MIELVESSSRSISLVLGYIFAKLIFVYSSISNFMSQKAFEKHKIPQKEVYLDVLGTNREKTPPPPKSERT